MTAGGGGPASGAGGAGVPGPGPHASGSDDELRARFAEMRRREGEAAPTFSALSHRAAGGGGDRRSAPAARRVLPVPVAAVLAVLALAALAVIVRPWDRMRGPTPAPRETRPAPLITAWRSPTDFLLHTPGEEVLRTTPSFGSGLPPLADAGLRPRRAARPRHETPTHRRS